MKPDVWRFVNQQIAKRKREKGKDSEVYLYGVLCPPSKVRKETARHGFVSTIDMFRPGNTLDEVTLFGFSDNRQIYLLRHLKE